jgi:hypothetical protein
LKQVKAITGAVAAKVKVNLFAMDRTKAQLLRRWNTKPLKTKQFIFAAANKLQTNPCAMVRTVNCKNSQKWQERCKNRRLWKPHGYWAAEHLVLGLNRLVIYGAMFDFVE